LPVKTDYTVSYFILYVLTGIEKSVADSETNWNFCR